MTSNRNLTKVKAVIFDMDGVLVDTNPHHRDAWRQYYQQNGKTLSDADFVQYVSGKHNKDIVAHLFDGKALTSDEVVRLSHEKEALFRDLYKPVIQPVAGLIDFLKALKDAGIRTAVATSAPAENLQFVMDALNIRSYFDTLLDESMADHPKPDPEIYQKAMQQLEVTPGDSIVFEDSMTGIQAAKASGAYVVGVATTQSPEELRPFVDDVIRDFTEMTVKRLQQGLTIF